MKTFEVQVLLPRSGKLIKYIRSIEISLSENRSIDSLVEFKSIDLHSIDQNLQGKINRSIDFVYFRKDLQMLAAFCVAQIHHQVVRS
jgi:hypothetical protein